MNRQKIFQSTPSTRLIKNIVFCFFLIVFTILVLKIFFIHRYLSSYIAQEWLINYSAGFIRRGLFGSILLFLHNHYNLDVFKSIRLFSYFTFLLFSSIYIFKIRRSIKNLDLESLLVILFLPSLILFPLHDRQALGRKEILFFFGLFVNIFLFEKAFKNLNINQNLESDQDAKDTINRYCLTVFIGYNLLSIPTALSHESILFLSLPLNMIITSSLLGLKFSKSKVLTRTLMIYLPTISVTLLCFIFQGNHSSPLVICQSLQLYIDKSINCDPLYLSATGKFSLDKNIPLSLQYFGLPLRYHLTEVWTNNISAKHGTVFLKWIIAFGVCIIISMRISSKVLTNSLEKLKQKLQSRNQDDRALELLSSVTSVSVISSFSFKYFVIPFLFSSVLYFSTQDWGRWFFMTSTNYVICLLSSELILVEIIGNSQKQPINRDKKAFDFLLPAYAFYAKIVGLLYRWQPLQRFYGIYLAILIFTLFVLKIPHHAYLWSRFLKPLKPWLVDLLG